MPGVIMMFSNHPPCLSSLLIPRDSPYIPGIVPRTPLVLKEYTSITPVSRHSEKFNAAFLDGHAEPCTYEQHYNAKYFTQPEP